MLSNISLKCPVRRDPTENKYSIEIVEGVLYFEPYPSVGRVVYNGLQKESAFTVKAGDQVDFFPSEYPGQLTWDLAITSLGFKAVAKVKHEKPGYYVLPDQIVTEETITIKDAVQWRDDTPKGQYWTEQIFSIDLNRAGIVHGVYPWAWAKITNVIGTEEIEVAEGTPAVPPTPSNLIDCVGVAPEENPEDGRIDYFASKIRYVSAEEVLAKKIPGKPGIPGKNVKGQDLPVPVMHEYQFVLKKNVRLSDDGLEIIAKCAGLPVRTGQWTYSVENIYIQRTDVDLATGSIDFPGNVYVDGNVQDGFHVHSGGQVEIRGSVSKAEIRAETGLIIRQSLIGGKIIVGENYLNRSKLLQILKALHDHLTLCLSQTETLISRAQCPAQGEGQYLKLILEQKHTELPKIAASAEKFVLETQDALIDQELIVAVRTAKHFLSGLGPLDKHAYPFLQRVNQAFAQLINNFSLEIPEKLECSVGYIQGATVECAGTLECINGMYNSNIHADGDVVVKSVCRGSVITSRGNVKIKELGGAGVSITTIQFPGSKRLRADFCHSNVVIIVDKEVTRIDEDCRALEVYREDGRLQVEKFRSK